MQLFPGFTQWSSVLPEPSKDFLEHLPSRKLLIIKGESHNPGNSLRMSSSTQHVVCVVYKPIRIS